MEERRRWRREDRAWKLGLQVSRGWLGMHWKLQEGLMFFFFNDTATTEIYTLSLHDALPICGAATRNGQ